MTTNAPRTWVFLRGLASHPGHWGHFVEHFRLVFPEDRIELLTLKGNGERLSETSPATIRENVLDLRRQMVRRLGHGARVHFLGTSMGAMVGVEWAELFPEDLLSLTCVNTSDGSASPFFHRMQFYNVQQMKGLFEYSGMTNTTTPNMLRQIWACFWHTFPKEKPEVPMLFVASARDQFANPDCTLRICAKWNLEPNIHPRGSHDLPVDDPSWTVGKIRDFLKTFQAEPVRLTSVREVTAL